MKPRSHMISVRFSEDEYSAVLHYCSLTGARSASGMIRDAVQSVLNNLRRDDSLVRDLDDFRTGIRNLESKVAQLDAKLASINLEIPENDSNFTIS